jgi:hypothetical protein
MKYILTVFRIMQQNSRRTFDRRLKTISKDIKERILTMGYLFVEEGMTDPSITATDSTLKSKR